MKRILPFLLLLTLLWGCSSQVPQNVKVGYYTYSVENGGAIITDCDETISGDITLPTTLGGYKVTAIGDNAFSNCALTSVTIGKSVTAISPTAFYDCPAMTGIYVDSKNPAYCSDDRGMLFSKDKTTLLQVPPASLRTYTVPAGVTAIGPYALACCRVLVGLELPDSLQTMDNYAFHNCTSLAYVYYGGKDTQWAAVNSKPLLQEVPDILVNCNAVMPEFVEIRGDLNGVNRVEEYDAIYLLRHVLSPEDFPLTQTADYDKNGTVNEDDAIYLLMYALTEDADTYPIEE